MRTAGQSQMSATSTSKKNRTADRVAIVVVIILGLAAAWFFITKDRNARVVVVHAWDGSPLAGVTVSVWTSQFENKLTTDHSGRARLLDGQRFERDVLVSIKIMDGEKCLLDGMVKVPSFEPLEVTARRP